MTLETINSAAALQGAPSQLALPGAAAGISRARRRPWFRLWHWLLAVCVGLVIIWFVRVPLLRNVAAVLGADAAPRPVQFVCLQGGFGSIERAAVYVRRNPGCRVVLFRQPRNRIYDSGLIVPFDVHARDQLRRAGIPESDCLFLNAETGSDWEQAELITNLLESTIDSQMLLLCEQFSGRRWQWILRKTMPDSAADRVHVQAVPREQDTVDNWWLAKSGVLDVWNGYLGLIFVGLHGREYSRPKKLSAEDYETNLLRSVRPDSAGAVKLRRFGPDGGVRRQTAFGTIPSTSLRKECRNNSVSPTTISLTFDDAHDVHLDLAVPLLNELGLRGTFFVDFLSSNVGCRAADWRRAASEGHELGNHSLFHPGYPPATHVSDGNSLAHYTLDRMRLELQVANNALRALDGRSERSFAYPNANPVLGDVGYAKKLLRLIGWDRTRLDGWIDHWHLDLGATLQNYTEIVRPLFVAARGGSVSQWPKAYDPHFVPSYVADGRSLAELRHFLEQRVEDGNWGVFTFHGIGDNYALSCQREVFEQFLNELAGDSRVTVKTFLEASRHLRSGEASDLATSPELPRAVAAL